MPNRPPPRKPRAAFDWRIHSTELRYQGLSPAALDGTDTHCGCGIVPIRPRRRPSGGRQRR